MSFPYSQLLQCSSSYEVEQHTLVQCIYVKHALSPHTS